MQHHHATGSSELPLGSDRLRQSDFQRLARFIEQRCGIRMPPAKQTMLEGRLRKRVVATGCSSLADYCDFLFERDGLEEELVQLFDVVTTNKTDFFREPEHFRFLSQVALPTLIADRQPGQNARLTVWSAASSNGAEPYTLAMVLAEFARRETGVSASLLGTDISTRVLHAAALGIYPAEMVAPVPQDLQRRYLMRSRDRASGLVRIVPELRRMARFRRLNLVDESYPVESDFDVIFCRNVLIYFDKPLQQAVVGRLCSHLRPGGYLFLGHSETLSGTGLPVQPVASSVFRRL